jgi:MFS transporter, DHA1 family, inner membrane transport protein
MRIRILILALGTFAIGTDGFVIAGILPEIARGLKVPVSTAGFLITIFAWAYALGSPVLATMTGKLERKRLLLVSMVVFVVANVLAAFAPSFGILVGARILAAFGSALYTPAALAVAVSLAPAEKRARALALVLAGLTVATVLGVPLGILIATQLNWQTTFLVVAMLGVLAFIGVLALFPAVARPPIVTLKARLALLRRPALLVMLGNLLLWQMSVFVLYTYLGPILLNITHVSGIEISGIFLLFGLASALGNIIGGYSTDRWGAVRVLFVALVLLTMTEFILPWAAISVFGITITMLVWGIAGWMVVPPQQYRVIALAPSSSTILLSLNGSVIYLGIGTGAALGGLVLNFAPLTALGWVSGGLALAALGCLFLSTWVVSKGVYTLLRRYRV